MNTCQVGRLPVVASLQYVDVAARVTGEDGNERDVFIDHALVDSGSQVNMLPTALCQEIKDACGPLVSRTPSIRIEACGGSAVTSEREIDINIKTSNGKVKTTFLVANDIKRPILNRDTCVALDLFTDKPSKFCDGNQGAGPLKRERQADRGYLEVDRKSRRSSPRSGSKERARTTNVEVKDCEDLGRTNEEFFIGIKECNSLCVCKQAPANKKTRYVHFDNEKDLSTEEVRKAVEELLEEFQDIMDDKSKPLSVMKGEPMVIKTKPGERQSRPIRQANPLRRKTRGLGSNSGHGATWCVEEIDDGDK